MIKLKIVTPQKIFLTDNFEMVTVPAQKGELAILPDHVPILANLKAGLIAAYSANIISKKIIINSGILNFANNEATILTEEIIDKQKYNKKYLTNQINILEDKLRGYLQTGNDVALNQTQAKITDLLTIQSLLS